MTQQRHLLVDSQGQHRRQYLDGLNICRASND